MGGDKAVILTSFTDDDNDYMGIFANTKQYTIKKDIWEAWAVYIVSISVRIAYVTVILSCNKWKYMRVIRNFFPIATHSFLRYLW